MRNVFITPVLMPSSMMVRDVIPLQFIWPTALAPLTHGAGWYEIAVHRAVTWPPVSRRAFGTLAEHVRFRVSLVLNAAIPFTSSASKLVAPSPSLVLRLARFRLPTGSVVYVSGLYTSGFGGVVGGSAIGPLCSAVSSMFSSMSVLPFAASVSSVVSVQVALPRPMSAPA